MFFHVRGVMFFLAAAVMPAFSATVTSTNRSLWQTDVGAFESVTFEDLATGYGTTGVVFYDGTSSSQLATCPSIAAEQACFQNAGGAAFEWIINTGTAPAPAANRHFRLSDPSGYLQILVAPGTVSFGMDFYTVSLDNRPITVTVFGDVAGTNILGTYTSINPNFFGIVGTDSIAMIRLSNTTSEIYLDQFDFAGLPDNNNGGGSDPGGDPGNPPEVPEAATLAYMASGLLAIWAGIRKRRLMIAV